jgi:hypothetical protein
MDSNEQATKKRTYLSQSDVPAHSLDDALRVASAIADQYGKQPTNPVDVATALQLMPTGGHFKTLTGAAVAYGITGGGSQADLIELTDLGRRIVAPTEEGDDLVARREALLRPRVVREFLQKYDGSSLPTEQIGRNVLEEMGVPADRTQGTLALIVSSADSLGLLSDINGRQVVNLRSAQLRSGPTPGVDPDQDEIVLEEESELDQELAGLLGGTGSSRVPEEPKPERPSAIFVGGRKGKNLDQLTKILNEYKIPYKLAEDAPNKGRPISQKVADTMRECGAAIIVFTPDEELRDLEGNPVFRPSENVVHELGAAGVEYGNRIVIFREESVTLASNYSDIGHITFKDGELSAKGIELFRELIEFGLVKVTVGQ